MAIRTEQAQLIITIDAKEGVKYRDILTGNKTAINDLKKLKQGQDGYNEAIQKQIEISKKLQSVDVSKVAVGQLRERRAELSVLQKSLSAAQFAEAGFQKELKMVNDQLAISSGRTRRLTNDMNGFSKGGFWSNIKQNVLGIAAGFAVFEIAKRAITGLISVGKESLQLFDKQAKADAQLKAAIQSTNGAAGRSFEQLKEQASALQQITLFGDEQTQQAQALLLTFTNVREEIFDRSIPAIQDYATAMGTDMKGASVQVGKALNDPIKGVTALGKAGVQFSEDQKAMIASLVESGDLAGAQTIILKELETQFKGSAEAAAKAGLGPYQQLSNRIGDVKEQFGLLVERGLKFALPFIEKVTTFIEKFVNSLVHGEKATGDMSAAVNFLVGWLKILWKWWGFLIDVISTVVTRFISFINILKDIPVLGLGVKALIGLFNGLVEVVSNTSAVFAGLKAAIQQTFDNAANYIKKTLLTLQIFAKEAELLMSFKDETKNRLQKEIKQLESLKADASKAGKTVGEAYRDAYIKQISDEAAAAKISKQTAAEDAAQRVATKTIAALDEEGETKTKSGKTKTEKDKKEKGFITFTPYDPALLQKVLDYELKQIESATKKREEMAELQYLQGLTSEDEYNIERLRIRQSGIDEELRLLASLGQQEGDKYRELSIAQLKVQKEIRDERSRQIIGDNDALVDELDRKFIEQLITEQEYQRMKLDGDLAYYEEKLRLLEEAGLTETDTYKKLYEQQTALLKEKTRQELDTVRQTEEAKRMVQEEGLAATRDIYNVGLDLLKENQQGRRVLGAAIKAFEISNVITSAQAEIAGVQKSMAALGPPGWGIAQARSLFIALRAGASIAKIATQKFQYGGIPKGTVLDGPSHADGGIPISYGEFEGGEAVINKKSTRIFRPLLSAINNYRGYGRKFELGDIVGSTTPTGLSGVAIAASQSPAASALDTGAIKDLTNAMRTFANVVPVALSNIRAQVSYESIRQSDNTVAEIERLASF
jgi:hypothetical protein